MNVILGFVGEDSKLGAGVKDGLEKENLKIDDIKIFYSKKAIEEYITTHIDEVDVVILNEVLEPDNPYREKEIERLTAINERLRIILTVSGEHYGDDFLVKLFNLGFYNAIFDKDSSMSNLAALIKASRSRRVTMAYYGISNANIIIEPKKPEVLTVGMALDMVNECNTDTDKIKMMKQIYSEMQEADFRQFVKHLNYKVYELGATDKELSVFFPLQTEIKTITDTVIQYKEIKNEVIAVIDEGNTGGRSTYLSFAIAQGIAATTNLKPSYVRLPVTDATEAFDILPFDESFKAQFVSHLQAVADGVPYPVTENIYKGVSIVCRNPVVDILDKWDELASYKCMYNASSPVILDVGSEVEQMKSVLKEVSMWIVVVPADVPVGAYLVELKKKLGVVADIPVIALTYSTAGIYQSQMCVEYGFNQIYESDICYDTHQTEINTIISLTAYGEGMMTEKKKTHDIKDKKFMPVKLNGTKEIAVIGSGHGCGCTYSVISIAALLSRFYRVAVLEANSSHDFECLAANTRSKLYRIDNAFTFSYKGINFYYDCTYDYFRSYLKSGYDFVIYDCGVDNMDVFKSADCKIAAVSGAVWRMDEVDILARQLDKFDTKKKVSCLVNGKHTKELSNYRILCHKRNFYGLPYMPDPTKQCSELVTIVSKLSGVPLKL